ncbi:NAD-dependent epimerase/dehydratase family protein [soil metagenome]
MRKILVTGGAGFIASSLADKLIEDPENFVVIIDNLLTGKLSRLPKKDKKNWCFIKCDVNNVNDITAVMVSYSFDYVFHYAAVVGVQRTLENPVMVLNDTDGIKNVLNLSKNTGVKRVFYASSSEVYGEPTTLPQNEYTTPLNSRLPYAVVKNIGEAYCKSYKLEYDLDYTIYRFFNTYGPKQSTDFVMSRFITMALKGKDLTVFGDGQQSRTFCYVDDNVTATTNCLFKDLFVNDIVNIGSEIEISMLDLANLIIKVTGSNSKVQHLPPLAEGDMKRRVPDNSKMKQLIDGELTSLEEGIKKVVELGKFK